MSLTVTKTVRELALEIPNATRVFEKLGIDYCCGGQKSLGEACAAINLPIADVLNQLNHTARAHGRRFSGLAGLASGRPGSPDRHHPPQVRSRGVRSVAAVIGESVLGSWQESP